MSIKGATMNIRFTARIFAALVLTLGLWLTTSVNANDMPLAAGSPVAGINFDDRPLLLPVQRNFQMAMLTASSELGRSCGHMEAYGWRMDQSEQQRVNQIFNNTVDRLRAQGFSVESKNPNSVSHDVTMFTADRTDKHLVFMWSAGEIGLVMVLCETSAPLTGRGMDTGATIAPMSTYKEASNPLRRSTQPVRLTTAPKRVVHFTPVGDWVGSYTCAQGTTGGTLHITKVHGDNFEGMFRFYPTPKNPYVPTGRYLVFGQYDSDSQRILINPGKWLERPKDYYNTIMIGSFDPTAKTFSGFFQGITGCTSFEARYSIDSAEIEDAVATKTIKHKHQKKAHKKAAAVTAIAPTPMQARTAVAAPVPTASPMASPVPPTTMAGIKIGEPLQMVTNPASDPVLPLTPPPVAPAVSPTASTVPLSVVRDPNAAPSAQMPPAPINPAPQPTQALSTP